MAFINSSLRNYLIEDEIGKGGAGSVFKAKDIKLLRNVAIKEINNEDSNQKLIAKREATMLAKISHPNIMSVYDILEESSNTYIIMELLEGQDLNYIIKTKKLSINNLLDIFVQVSDALDYIHSNNIIHRDIKPHNVFVLNNNRVRLIDFGVAVLQDNLKIFCKNELFVGTLGYVSPEQLKNTCEIDYKSDIFSFGVLMYEALTNKLPFEGNSHKELIENIFYKEPVPLNQIIDIPDSLSEIIMSCLDKNPDNRPTSNELLNKLSIERILLIKDLNTTNKKDTLQLSSEDKTKSFGNYSIFKIIKNINENKEDGKLIINSENKEAEIYFKNGQILTSSINYKELESIDALFEIITFKEGYFKLEKDKTTDKNDFKYMPTEILIDSCENTLLEFHQLVMKYNLKFKLRFKGDINIVYDPRAKEIAELLDGKNELSYIINKINLDIVSVLKIIDNFSKQNFI